MAPWEKYQNNSVASSNGAGPWAKYQAHSTPKFNDQEAADISFLDRAKVKNFGGEKGSIQYLQQRYPDMEFQKHNGEIFAKKRGENEFKALDPDTGFFSTDFLRDVGDIAFDVGAGIVEGGATALGAIGGTMAAPGAGTVAGGVTAGGAAGAGTEALRQKLGQYLGVRGEDEFDGTDVAISGALGAASPLMFGAGNAGKGALKNVAKGSFADTGAFGQVKKMGGKVARGTAELTSGVKSKHYKTYMDNFDELERMGGDDMADLAVETFGAVEDGLETLKKELGEGYNKIKASGEKLDLSSLKTKIDDEIAKIDARAAAEIGKKQDPALKNQLTELKDSIFGRYGEGGKKVGEFNAANMDIDHVFEVKDTLSDFSSWNKMLSELDPKVGRDISKVARREYADLNKNIANKFKKFPELKKKYRDFKVATDTLNKYKTGKGVNAEFEEKALGALKDLDSKAARKLYKNQSLRKIAKKGGVDISDAADKVQAWVALKDPGFMPVSGTSTSTSRSTLGASVGMAGAGNLGPAGQGLAMAGGLTMLGPKPWKAYLRGGQMADKGFQKVWDTLPGKPQQKWQTILNLMQKKDEDKR